MKKSTTMFLGGFLSAAVIFGALPAVAANIAAKFNSVNVEVNGAKVAAAGESYTLANGTSVPNSISYADTTYLPLRKVGEILGLDVSYDGKTNTAVLQKKTEPKPSSETSNQSIQQTISNMSYDDFKHSFNIKIDDSEKAKTGYISVSASLLLNSDVIEAAVVSQKTQLEQQMAKVAYEIAEQYPTYAVEMKFFKSDNSEFGTAFATTVNKMSWGKV